MNAMQKKRYVFIDFENLQKVKFKKLERVCDRMFILIDSSEKSIPFALVRQIQRLGKAIKWVPIERTRSGNMNYHLAFLMGRLHQKVNKDVEFAILSDDRHFDALVNFINESGRPCLRVKSKKETQAASAPILPKMKTSTYQQVLNGQSNGNGKAIKDKPQRGLDNATSHVKETARETMERLIRSGNRPAELEMLRNYILLHNQELTQNENVDIIIRQMEEDKNIAITESEVIYNF